MAGETYTTIIGNATGDPELRFTQSGVPVANFSVAATIRTYDKDTNRWKDGLTSFHRVVCWRDLAENVAEFVQKGKRVIVYGDLQQETYEKDGATHYAWKVNASAVGLDLTFVKVLPEPEPTTTERPADRPKRARQSPLQKAGKAAQAPMAEG